MPAPRPQATHVPGVAATIGLDLGLPCRRKLVPPHREAPAVPEVAIREYRHTLVPKHEVRPPREIGGMGLEGDPGSGKQIPDGQFQAGVTTLDSRHQRTALFGGHDVAAMATRARIAAALRGVYQSGQSRTPLVTFLTAIPCPDTGLWASGGSRSSIPWHAGVLYSHEGG